MVLEGSILVVGAGELGSAVLEALAAHPSKGNTPISVLLRNATIHSKDEAKQRMMARLHELKVTPVAGDIANSSVSTLAAIFSQYHTVLSCAGYGLPSGTQTKLTRAALESQVARFFPWQYGVNYDVIGAGSEQDLFDEQLECRSLLRAQNQTDWVLLSTGVFTSFLFEPSFGIVDLPNDTVRALGSWSTQITCTTPEDIARVVAELVYEPRDVKQRIVYSAGDTISYGELAKLVEAKVGRTLSKEEWTIPKLKAMLGGDPDNKLNKYRSVFAAGKGVAWPVDQTVNFERGMSMTDVGTYVRNNM